MKHGRTVAQSSKRGTLAFAPGCSSAGAGLHAEHVDALLQRIDELRERDLNAIRLRR
jgi:hypothetical protein